MVDFKDTKRIKREIANIVKQSGSSFYWGMRFLPKEKKEAMFAIYAFCRIVDDIVDEPLPLEEKQHALNFWREEIERIYKGEPQTIVGVEIVQANKLYNLEKDEFIKLIEGVAMDIPDGLCAPTMKELEKYCRGVAGAVGMLSIKVFGCYDENAKKFAIALGDALQLTNILRDPFEDMKMGRLYLPKEILEQEDIKIGTAKEILTNRNIGKVREKVASIAEEKFQTAKEYYKKTDAKKMKPAIIMMNVYYDILKNMEKRGWDILTPKPKTNKVKILTNALVTHFRKKI